MTKCFEKLKKNPDCYLFWGKNEFSKKLGLSVFRFYIIYHHVKKAVKANRQLPAKIQPII